MFWKHIFEMQKVKKDFCEAYNIRIFFFREAQFI